MTILLVIFMTINRISTQVTTKFVKSYHSEIIEGQIIAMEWIDGQGVLIATGNGIFIAPAYDQPPVQIVDYDISFMRVAGPYLVVVSEKMILFGELEKVLQGEALQPLFAIQGMLYVCDVDKKTVNFTDAIYYEPLQELWLSTPFSGIFRFEYSAPDSTFIPRKDLRIFRSDKRSRRRRELPTNQVNTMLVDMFDNIWIGTAEGLCVHRPDTSQQRFRGENWLKLWPDVNVSKFLKISERKIWLSGTSKAAEAELYVHEFTAGRYGMPQIAKTGRIRVTKEYQNNFIYDVTTDQAGSFWFGSEAIGRIRDLASLETDSLLLPRLAESDKTVVYYNKYEGFPSVQAAHIRTDDQGYVWIGTGGQGVFTLKKKPEVEIAIEDIVCAGETNGKIHLTPVDGEPPFEYIIASEKNGHHHLTGIREPQTLDHLSEDSFKIVVLDAHRLDTAVYYVTVTEPDSISATLEVTKDIDYQEASDRHGVAQVVNVQGGKVNISLHGGADHQGYRYSWNGDVPIHSPLKNKLDYGPFSVSVIDTVGCSKVLHDTIYFPKEIIAGHYGNRRDYKVCRIKIDEQLNFEATINGFIRHMNEMDRLMSIGVKQSNPIHYTRRGNHYAQFFKSELLKKGINERRVKLLNNEVNDQKNTYLVIEIYYDKKVEPNFCD